MNTRARHLFCPLVLLLARLAVPADAETHTVPFTADRWDLQGAEVKEHLGRSSLTGTAWLKDVIFEDGVVETDLATDRQRSYPAIIFRREAEGEYEHVYLRPHRAGLYPDAVQYAPVFSGVAGWQLYSKPGFTAGLSLPENQWVHIRIEVKGTQARVFVGDGRRPALVIDELKRGRSRGAIGLQCERNGSVHFSNFSYAVTEDLSFDPPQTLDPVPGIINDWALSPTAGVFDLAAEQYLDGKPPSAISWLPVKSETSGLVDIARFRKPLASGTSKVWARAIVHATQKESRPFCFGYSDDVSIYLNGRILFHGLSGFQRRDPSFLGIIGWNDTVYLPLEAGDNELVLAVSEKFGGWGFMVRDMNAIYRAPGLRDVWELSSRLNAPESVVWDAARQAIYVSNFGGGFISKIGPDGTLVSLKWVEGLRNPTGLKLHAGKLYAVERTGIAEIDPEQGVIIARQPIPDGEFLNDLDFDEMGAIYVTDTSKNCVFRLSAGKSEVWVQVKMVGQPNGILVEKDRVLVGVTDGGTLKSVDRKTRQVTTFLTLGPGANMDGLVSDGKGGYLFSDYYGRIYCADAAGRKTLLLDRRGPHQYTADFEYIPEKRLLVVPSLYDNRLTAYELATP